MAVPAVLLKAKNLVKKGAKAKTISDNLKSQDSESSPSFLANNKYKLIIIGGAAAFLFAIIAFLMILMYPLITVSSMFTNIFGTESGTAYAQDLTSVESPIESLQEGLAIPHYLQYDSRWGSKPYPYSSGGSNTIAASACGPSSFAMVASYLTGKIYTPDMVLLDGKYHNGGGTSWGYFAAAAQTFNCGSVKETSNWNEVYNSLKDGHPVIGSYNGASLFTNNGHFIVLRGVASDGSVLVNDPNDNQSKKFVNRHFTQSEMQRGGLSWWIFDKKNGT